MNLEKYGKYKWEYDKGNEFQADCYFQFDPKLVKMSEQGYLDLELRNVDYDEDDVGKLMKPTYYLEMWCDDEYWVYKTNNLNNCRGVLNKFVKKIVALIDEDNLTWDALCAIGKELHIACDERNKKENKDIMNKRLKKWANGIWGGLKGSPLT